MSKTQTKERSPAERHAYLRAALVQAQKLVPPPVPKQAYRHFTMKKSHSPCGKCTQIGNTHSLPHTYLLSTSLPLIFRHSHSLSMVEPLLLQQLLSWKRLKAAEPLVSMFQYSNTIQAKGKNGNLLQTGTVANPQLPPCVAPGVLTARVLISAFMPRAIPTAFYLISTLSFQLLLIVNRSCFAFLFAQHYTV